MGKVHQLILSKGIDEAKAQTADKLERQCVETAFAVMSDEQQRIGIMHAGFAMTALPHKAIDETIWVRQGNNIKLRLESGMDADDKVVGLPFGAIARIILLYLQTEAVKTKSRDIELGRSMNHWLTTMGIDNGGKTYKLVREQSRRLSLCRLTFYRVTDEATIITNGSFVRDAILPSRDTDQLQFWREAVRLDEGFFQSLIDHPLPVREAAIREIGHRSMALDIYVWLAYRLHQLSKPTAITWKALHDQFGGGYQHVRQFKAKFKEPLALALAAYPEAILEAGDAGLKLYPSPPAVAERRLGGVTRVRT
ncbi:pirin [Acidisoma cellulosilytica]|uniref:Pirin n=1 Tax=Acidisoma cellulosilyticum TaxID=2802395 RepID=A0A963Z8Y2_9PROT|nr:replication protein RepA [Acidisoma cellulosilyticum]MCB8884033.1 pirin [Acidisoma cellulosilyticum]